MANWITTPLKSGALGQNNYSCNLTGLTANSIYEYRSYMVVAGIPYCGEILQGMTCNEYTYPLNVTTGCACDISPSTMRICDNVITHSGTSLVTEYGVLYTQNAAFGCEAELTYDNYPTNICKVSTCNAISEGQSFFIGSINEITGLDSNTLTYYRAFATNNSVGESVGGICYGYGNVNTTITDPPLTIPISVSLDRTGSQSVADATGCVTFNPVIPVSSSISLIFNVDHLTGLGSSTITEIFCHAGGGDSIATSIYYLETISETVANNDVIVPVNTGDVITWSHVAGSGAGSYGDLKICGINNHTFGIQPVIDTFNCCDRVYSSAVPII